MGPYALIQKDKPVEFMAKSNSRNEDDDEEAPKHKFYESDKILGKLFRAIDEQQVFSSVQNGSGGETSVSNCETQSVLKAVWRSVSKQCQHLQWQRHVPRARGIRDEYVLCSHISLDVHLS